MSGTPLFGAVLSAILSAYQFFSLSVLSTSPYKISYVLYAVLSATDLIGVFSLVDKFYGLYYSALSTL
jgi:hypothetical protein